MFFQRTYLLPHNCGEGTPQLWGGFTTVVGKVHHSCGAITIKGIKTTFLLQITTFKEEKTGVVFGCFCWKWVARGDNFVEDRRRLGNQSKLYCTHLALSLQAKRREGLLSRKQSSVRGRGAVASRPWSDRVLCAGRSYRGRGAMKIKEEETTFLLKRTTFKEKKTGVVFGHFCWKWVAREDIFADENPRNNFNHKLLCSRFFCPRISRIYTNAMRFENGDLFGRTNFHEFNEGG